MFCLHFPEEGSFLYPVTQVNLNVITCERKSTFLAQQLSFAENQKVFAKKKKKKSENISIQGHSYLNKSQPASRSRRYLYFEPGNICLMVGGHVTVS